MNGAARFWAAVALVVCLAAALRFTGLGFGLRHRPYPDERVFVENAHRMVAERSLDHRYYEYPGLMFGLLAPGAALVGVEGSPSPKEYLAARSLVAAFGVLSVLLVAVLGRRLMGSVGAVAAALFLAASLVEVDAAHMVKPDVVLEAFALAAFLAFRRISERVRGDVAAGAALGAAVAVKFSGVLLVPSYLLHRALTPGARVKGLVLAALSAALVFFVLTPYSVLHAGSFFGSGVLVQLRYHYAGEGASPAAYLAAVQAYLGTLVEALGPAAYLALPAVFLRREWRTWAPLLLFPVVVILTFSTSSIHHDRFLVPSLGVVALAAGRTIDAIDRRHRGLALGLALAAAAPGLSASARFVWHLTRPGTQDRVASWAAAQLPTGARILNLATYLELDRTRFEVVDPSGSSRLDPYLARHVDFVVAAPDQAARLEGMPVLYSADPASPEEGPPLAVFRVPESRLPRYRRLDLSAARLSASENPADLDWLRDGSEDTQWSTENQQKQDAWIEVDLGAPVLLGRIELELGPRRNRWGRALRVFVSDDGKAWRAVPAAPGRGPVDEQPGTGTRPSQVLILAPACVRGLRIVQEGRAERRWAIAELHLEAMEPTTPPPEARCSEVAPAQSGGR